jgi:sulfite exporter TauE/SafE
MVINIFNPVGLTLVEALLVAFVLGVVHGITPDEHTWPITFSYAIGSYSTKGGAKAGFLFSLGFTAQRAVISELAFLFLAPFLLSSGVNGIIYVIVGVVMALSGFYILRRGRYLHVHQVAHFVERFYHALLKKKDYEKEGIHEHNIFAKHNVLDPKAVPLKLAVFHGVIAGFGFGAFALILYTVITPQMPNAYFGWLPGLMFGIGTMVMQVVFGSAIGFWLSRRRYSERQISFIGRKTSGRVLAYGGVAFFFVGMIVILLPSVTGFGISTGIGILNLNTIDIGFLLAVGSVTVIAVPSYLAALNEAKRLGKEHPQPRPN